jgi:hypothetical protein
MLEIIKQILRIKKGYSSRDMYFLREIMRTLLTMQSE